MNSFQIVEPTVEWAQDLHRVYLEVKFAHRFDAPGCANHTQTEIELHDEFVTLKVLCHSISSKIKYDLKLHFWEQIDAEKSVYNYQAVGKYQFTLRKKVEPRRWRQLYEKELPKPLNMRLNLELHEKYARSLLDFGDGDEVWDFAGRDHLEDVEEEWREK